MPCHDAPQCVQVITPFAVRLAMYLKQLRCAYSACAGVMGRRCALKRATTCCIFVLGFIVVSVCVG